MAMPSEKEQIKDRTYRELESLAQTIAERMRELRETGLELLHDELEEKANNLGYSLAELITIAKKKKRRSRRDSGNGPTAQPE